MAFIKPLRYYVAFTNRRRWEAAHRKGSPAEVNPDDLMEYRDARTLRQARKLAAGIRADWEFSQPQIRRRDTITAVSWDYTSEPVDES